jgi:hypothetical protein
MAMAEVIFRDRKAVQLENDSLRLTVLREGGHIAEVFDKRAGVSPLWIPHWPSLEPSAVGAQHEALFGGGSAVKLLAGIMGHNLCLDLFGGPSEAEAALGLTDHGEASIAPYEMTETASGLQMRLIMPLAQLEFVRAIELLGQDIRVRESVDNLSTIDRPLAWTQHVTLSPPYLDPLTTEFRASMTRSVVTESDPGFAIYLEKGSEFNWPYAPYSAAAQAGAREADLRKMHSAAPASSYTAHVVDQAQEDAYFVAFSPQYKLAFGYVWKSAHFPWMGIWEENCSRPGTPWDSRTVTRGMEFGVSPFPESRRAMIQRSRLLDTPTYKWLPARGRLEAQYWISSRIAEAIPDSLSWPEA